VVGPAAPLPSIRVIPSWRYARLAEAGNSNERLQFDGDFTRHNTHVHRSISRQWVVRGATTPVRRPDLPLVRGRPPQDDRGCLRGWETGSSTTASRRKSLNIRERCLEMVARVDRGPTKRRVQNLHGLTTCDWRPALIARRRDETKTESKRRLPHCARKSARSTPRPPPTARTRTSTRVVRAAARTAQAGPERADGPEWGRARSPTRSSHEVGTVWRRRVRRASSFVGGWGGVAERIQR